MDGIISDWAHRRTNARRWYRRANRSHRSRFEVRKHAPVKLCSYKPKGGPHLEPALRRLMRRRAW